MAIGRYIAERDWADWRKLIQEFRAVGKTLRRPGTATENRGRKSRKEFCKLDQAVTAGVLSSGETATLWRGPAWGGGDASLGVSVEIHHASDDMNSGTYCDAEWRRGKVYVVPLECVE